MNILEKATQLVKSSEVKEASSDFISDAMSALSGDIMALARLIKSGKAGPAFIEMQLFLERFEAFLVGNCIDDENIRSMGEVLSKYEDDPEFAKRILDKIIKVDTLQKTKYITNLTICFRYGYLSKRQFLSLCRIVGDVLEEDLQYLKKHITKSTITLDEYTEELQNYGLVYLGDSGLLYSELAFKLDKYALSFGDNRYKYNGEEDFVPVEFPPKAQIAYAGNLKLDGGDL
ncbi:hypothetical protein [Enterocloster clostridioformis]|uniref:hypothetical protein n=1 Tax=Enterocloster clostridioformis TaxID=1531 RepID=UPI00040CB224|nr:hypothetical protein [Enterocloster clostridioformis]